ncbi:type II toxin-antitoxin system YoeB family toxin [Parapedobacter composti]|uniref:type II toxin-antitoxin system YoeB family toxin n=1 Tax=Parapedobacter composti TaxID=623281 RepID=UPI000B8763BD
MNLKHSKKQYRLSKNLRNIKELAEHPRTGRGKPTLKRYDLAGFYARKITEKHRLVYSIDDTFIKVYVLSAKGHYNDK